MTPTAAQISATFSNVALASAGAAAVAIPILIHLLTRLRRRRMVWAAMRFLAEALRKQKRRLQLEQWLLLLVRCLIVLALAGALGRPIVRGLAEAWSGQPAGRFVCLVLDDSLSTQTRSESGRLRFELLREAALSIVDNLQPTDNLWVIRAARPWRQLAAPSAGDTAGIDQAIRSIKPRCSRADLIEALAAVARKVSDPGRVEGDHRPLVVVLSDFSAATVELDRPMPQPITDLAKSATLLLAQPALPAANVQVAMLRPRRRLIVTEDDAPVVAIEMQLRRFAADRGEAVTSVEFALTDDNSAAPLAKAHRRFRWSPGQSVAMVNVELPIDPAAVSAQQLAIEASITAADRGADTLGADNRRLAVIEVRRQLTVAILDASVPADDSAYQPAELLRFMLAPVRASAERVEAPGNPVSLVDVDVQQVHFASVEAADAAIVLRPDLLTAAGAAALGAFADRGGLLWLIAPAGDQPAAWATPLCQRLGLNWQVDVEPRSFPRPGTARTGAPDDPSPATFWTLALEPPPEPLDRLGADWEGLLRPIWVRRVLDVSDTGGQAQVWLSTAQGAPLLMAERCGEGVVLLLTAALDPDWTNLPVKKLFTPLFHDTLRSMVGAAGADSAVCGSRPTLHRRWENVQQLANSPGGAAVALKRGEDGVRPAQAFARPGIYTAPGEAGGLKLAVNVDAKAGDTRAVNAGRLKALLGGQWFDMSDPAKALLASRRETQLAWPLLWAVLALVLIETGLARWFSHASQAGRGGL